MPEWDPSARAMLEVNKKARNAVRLLTEQVRTEAAMLQFERDALMDAGGGKADILAGAKGWGGAPMNSSPAKGTSDGVKP